MIQKVEIGQPIHLYEILDYITTTARCKIDTNENVDYNTIVEITADVAVQTSGSKRLFSTYASGYNWNSPQTWAIETSNKIWFYPLGYSGCFDAGVQSSDFQGQKLRYKATASGYLTVYDTSDNVVITQDVSQYTSSSLTAQNIRLFAFSGIHEYLASGSKIYSVKIWQGNTLTHDYIPVKRMSDNECGLYDNIDKTFHPNEVSRYSFLGTPKQTPEYIDEQQTSTLYVNDIKFNGNSINRIYKNGVIYWGNEPYIQPQYLIHGTTTTTSNFNIKLNEQNVQVTVDPNTGEFYLETWTGTLTNLHECFDNLSHITSIDTFNIDTSSVTSYDNFLNRCSNLSSIDLSNINTSNATHLGGMFAQCPLLTSLDLSSFDTSKVNTCQYMFYMCSGLVSLNLNNWDLSLNTYYNTWMFQGCSSLTDVYINNSVTLNKLTNNLSSQGGAFIPSSATIHYNSTDYKWQNNAWTQQIQ